MVVCWLQTSFYDAVMAQTSEFSSACVRGFQKPHESAHRRYLAAIKTLATVRKLLAPSRLPVETNRKLKGEQSGLRLHKFSAEPN